MKSKMLSQPKDTKKKATIKQRPTTTTTKPKVVTNIAAKNVIAKVPYMPTAGNTNCYNHHSQ